MTDVAYNAPQYGYGGGVPQPPMPQPVPVDDEDPDEVDDRTSVASYDMDPAYEHAPPEHAPPAMVPPQAGPVGEAVQPTSGAPAVSSGRVAVQVVDRLRNTAERGTTTVPTEVIEKIATLAVREVPGVYQFGAAESGDKPMSIELDGRTAGVEMHLVIEYGFAVYAVTDKVRTKVISALENLFALDVTAVDIVIDDIHIDEPEPEAPAEG
jgi:uncharacterized alkaline shock family protein YloU